MITVSIAVVVGVIAIWRIGYLLVVTPDRGPGRAGHVIGHDDGRAVSIRYRLS